MTALSVMHQLHRDGAPVWQTAFFDMPSSVQNLVGFAAASGSKGAVPAPFSAYSEKRIRRDALSKMGGKQAGDVHGLALRPALDLMATGRAVGHQYSIGIGVTRGRQQRQFSHRQRHIRRLGLIAERARHTTATGFDLSPV